MKAKKQPIIAFPSQKHWHTWLAKYHAKLDGIWLRMYKKASKVKSVNYDEALDEALCYGWIDGQVKKYDTKSFIQRFTPRRKRSNWSKRNTEHAARLIKEKRMHSAGLEQINAAKQDGRWQLAYSSPSNMKVPVDFVRALRKYKNAYTFYQSLNKANIYAIGYQLQTAKKPETRERRFKKLIGMMQSGKKLH